jgi:hypothetical protein
MSDGDWIFRWWVLAIVAKPIVRLTQFVRLNRSRISDPDRDPGLAVRSVIVLLGFIFLVSFLGLLALYAFSMAIAARTDTAAVIAWTVSGLVGITVCIAASHQVISRGGTLSSSRPAIRLAHYVDAPVGVRKSMRRIYGSARSLRREEAFRRGVIEEKELQRLVYSAGQQAVLSSELSASVRGLRSSSHPADVDAIRDAERRIDEISRYLKDIEERLNRTTASAKKLSAAIVLPEQEQQHERERTQTRAVDELRQHQARQRMVSATLDAKPHDPEAVTLFEEQVAARYIGYQEAAQVSKDALQGPTLHPAHVVADGNSGSGEQVRQLAKSGVRKSSLIASSAVRRGAVRLRKRLTREG